MSKVKIRDIIKKARKIKNTEIPNTESVIIWSATELCRLLAGQPEPSIFGPDMVYWTT